MQPNVSLHKIYATDGIELDSILFEPSTPTKKIIIHVHGKEGHFIQNHFIGLMGNSYPQQGYALLTFNNRGHDYMADLMKKTATGYQWIPGGSMYDILEDFTFDIEGVLAYVRQLGYEEIILQGHSLGPHKICYYMTTPGKEKISKVVLLTTSDINYLFDTYVSEWESLSLKAKEMTENGESKKLMPVNLWSDCPVSAQTFWDYTKPDNNLFIFNGTHPEKPYKNFDSITQPLLVINPDTDFSMGISPQETIENLKKNTKSKNFEGYVVKNAVHNFLGKEEDLLKIILNWLG